MTTATTPEILEAAPLSADDVAAIKLADSYSLHTNAKLNVGDGSILRLYAKPTHTDKGSVFSTRQQLLFPITDILPGTRSRELIIGGKAHGYGFNGTGGWHWPNRWTEGAEHTPSCYFSGWDRETWSTIGRALRVGSVLTVGWTADNNTPIAEEAGLHLDSVRLIAVTGKHIDTWNIGSEACRDNSARMIRRQH